MSTRVANLVFAIFIISNIIIKSIYAAATPYSYDEIISVKDTLLDFGHIKHESEWDNNPPFYYYCLWVWHKLIPISEFNSRFLSVLFVSIGIGLTFLFSRKYFNNFTAVLSTLVLTFSNFITFYSQETRTYSIVFLLAIISSFLFFRYLRSNKIGDLFLLAFVNFLLIYSHYIAALILFFQLMLTLIFYRPIIKKYILVQLGVIVGLVWIRFTKKQFLNILGFNQREFWLGKATIGDLKIAVTQLYINKWVSVLFLILIVWTIVSVLIMKNDTEKKKVIWYSLFIGFVSVCFLFIVGIFKPVFLARYLIFSVPFATMIVCYQISTFKRNSLLGGLILVFFSLIGLNIFKESGVNFKDLAKVIRLQKRENDKIIVNTRDNLGLFEFYYSKESFLKYKNIDSVCESQGIYGVNEIHSMEKINFLHNSTVFLIQNFHKADHNEACDYFGTRSKRTFHTGFYKAIELTVFRY